MTIILLLVGLGLIVLGSNVFNMLLTFAAYYYYLFTKK